ncbi:MAG: hypothetical protein GY722_19735 [bacterium]|nr:hypothetical protein [bacterium]
MGFAPAVARSAEVQAEQSSVQLRSAHEALAEASRGEVRLLATFLALRKRRTPNWRSIRAIRGDEADVEGI